jgi:hypothetical protein
MSVYFVRSNGCSVHSLKDRPEEYVEGEPTGPFNYRLKCLEDGFARIGWPNTGDLLQQEARRLAPRGYSLKSISEQHRRYVQQWSDLRVGELVVIPADAEPYEVHLGVVVRRSIDTRQEIPAPLGSPAYYYFHDLPNGDWYECAHRVDVRWQVDSRGVPVVHCFPQIGGTWRRAFSRLSSARSWIEKAAHEAGLWVDRK